MTDTRTGSLTNVPGDTDYLRIKADRSVVSFLENPSLIAVSPPLTSLDQSPLSSWSEEASVNTLNGKVYKPLAANAELVYEFWGPKVGILFNKLGGEFHVELDGNPLTTVIFDFSTVTSRKVDSLELFPNQELDVTTKHIIKIKAVIPGSTYVQAFAVTSGYFPTYDTVEISESSLVTQPYYSQTLSLNGTNQLVNFTQIYRDIFVRSNKDIVLRWNNASFDPINIRALHDYTFSNQYADSAYVTATNANVTFYAAGK